MNTSIFLTGATGFLGSEVVSLLLKETDRTIYCLTRAENEEDARQRLSKAWYHNPELHKEIGSRAIPVIGDFTKEGLGLSSDTLSLLSEQVGMIIHCGAEIGLQKNEDQLLATNVNGTKNVLALAQLLHSQGSLTRLVHISTAYVAGQRKGQILESDAPAEDFSSLYEKSKAQAENLVRASGLPFTICRPGMIVGDSRTGRVKNFNTIYYVLKLLLTGSMKVLPVDATLRLNLVPVDYVAACVVKVLLSEDALDKTFHLTCPTSLQPTARELTDYVHFWAEENLAMDLPKTAFAPLTLLKDAGLTYNKKTAGRKKNALTNLLTLLPYFYGGQDFDRANTDALCGPYEGKWIDFIEPLLAFACRKNFMQQTGDSVFEQAKRRRISKRFPITYHDVSASGISTVTGEEVNERIDRIVDALWAWGLRPGDRIALTGINSVDYMTLDQAIGLIGAVSVPIYYTTPAEEAELLIQKSGAKWFFVGDSRMMQHIDQIKTDARIVAFSAGLTVHKPGVMHWEQFLYEAREHAPTVYVDPKALATIRYTSGTTGEPKGVMFSFEQLAWMGEVLTNLLPFKERNDTMRYLSFLPQSHVVEGILASYAPYYMLAKVDFYYLNDFGALVESLPKVRPTVFFSVPRFYEKLWDQLAANSIGKKYLAMQEGPAKDALGAVLKTVILKKAGLDACSQLIVGSAFISEALLLHFRKLGIEIHNAYGQTEAPLITINRMGDNIIPTIGTPLPDTEVTVTEDGELLVKGPQVALGYYGLEETTNQVFGGGVLHSGDLGSIATDGHITLYGRKKEMIITSYGKNISIPKVEEALKNIPAISEAVLIGEHRPYCTALIWLDTENGVIDSRAVDLDAQIEAMNQELSHPEQIKKYRIIAKPLSIAAGELTPNLKVKRGKVEEHYKEIIEEMYR